MKLIINVISLKHIIILLAFTFLSRWSIWTIFRRVCFLAFFSFQNNNVIKGYWLSMASSTSLTCGPSNATNYTRSFRLISVGLISMLQIFHYFFSVIFVVNGCMPRHLTSSISLSFLQALASLAPRSLLASWTRRASRSCRTTMSNRISQTMGQFLSFFEFLFTYLTSLLRFEAYIPVGELADSNFTVFSKVSNYES